MLSAERVHSPADPMHLARGNESVGARKPACSGPAVESVAQLREDHPR